MVKMVKYLHNIFLCQKKYLCNSDSLRINNMSLLLSIIKYEDLLKYEDIYYWYQRNLLHTYI